MKRLITILTVALMLIGSVSRAATINGVVLDAQDTTALIQATVKLLKQDKDSTFVKGTATDFNGLFDLKSVKPGKYYLRFSYVGYNDLVMRVTVGTDGRDVNLGVVKLEENSVVLGEAVIIGVKTPIIVKQDTVEYNADTYKTQSNAVVEDLLKRLPGVEVGSDGKITANGKEVKKILIDGKEFFSDDPTVASKNIPADMVNKLQVIDRRSDLARLTGVDDGEDETVINLTVKKGMSNGWFGTATAGYGTDNRYTANVMANYFANGNQFTFMGGANNTNNLGFTDGGAARFRRFGGDRGVTKAQWLGVNFNVGSKDAFETFRAGGSVMYSHTDRTTNQISSRTNIFTDSVSYRDAMSMARDKTHNLRGDFRIKWKADSFNTFEFRPNFSFNFSKSDKGDFSRLLAGDAAYTPVNLGFNSYDNDGKSYEFGGEAVFNHNFKSHPGRSYSAQLRYQYSNVREDGNTFSLNRYFLTGEDETVDQLYESKRKTNTINGRLTWTEPLGDVKRGNFITVAYRANYRLSNATKSVWDINREYNTPPEAHYLGSNYMVALLTDYRFRDYMEENYGSYSLKDLDVLRDVLALEIAPEINREFNTSLSNDYRNKFFNQDFQVGYRKVNRKYNLNIGFSVLSAMSKSTNLIDSERNIPSRWSWAVAPFARLRYKFTDSRNLHIFYNARATQPSIAQLQPVEDRSNPLNIVVGNPELKATFTHRMNIRFSDFDQKTQRSIMAMLGGSFEQNSIISTITNNSETGGQTTTYRNINGVWNMMGMNMLSFPFSASKAWYFTNQLFARVAQTKGYTDDVYNRNVAFSVNLSPGLAFRNGTFDVELRPKYGFQTTHNTVQTSSNRNVHTYGAMFNGTYSSPFGIVFSTDLNFTGTSGYSSGYDTKQWIWNASLAYQFLADKKASIQISVFDILGQQKNITRTQTASYVEDVLYNSLGRYGMLTFTYRFSSFKKGEEPKLRDDGPGGHRGPRGGGPGGRPMGPPPGGGRPPF